MTQVQQISNAVGRYLPAGTKVTRPQGGYVLWIELPPSVDSLELHRRALQQKISTRFFLLSRNIRILSGSAAAKLGRKRLSTRFGHWAICAPSQSLARALGETRPLRRNEALILFILRLSLCNQATGDAVAGIAGWIRDVVIRGCVDDD